MANELNIQLDPFSQTGLTLLARVYSKTGVEQTGSPVSMTEVGTALYSGDLTVSGFGDDAYSVRFETNTPDKLYGTGELYVRNGAEVSQEDFFNGALDTVANVTLVATTTTNTDMRGTDGANTVTPDNAGISSNGSAIAALNNFNPASDQVIVATNNDKTGYSISGTKTTFDDLNDVAATDIVSNGAINTLSGAVVNVDLVNTTTTNTDMRGTDGANTVVPDNAGIIANGNAIAALNDFDPANDTVANVNTVQTTISNSDMRGTDGANTIAPDNTTIAANATNIEELRANQVAANEGIKKSSLIIPYSDNLPNP